MFVGFLQLEESWNHLRGVKLNCKNDIFFNWLEGKPVRHFLDGGLKLEVLAYGEWCLPWNKPWEVSQQAELVHDSCHQVPAFGSCPDLPPWCTVTSKWKPNKWCLSQQLKSNLKHRPSNRCSVMTRWAIRIFKLSYRNFYNSSDLVSKKTLTKMANLKEVVVFQEDL